MPWSKQSSTQVPSGLFELVPRDENLISVSVTPGTPVILVAAPPPPEPLLLAVVVLPPEPSSDDLSSLELPHAASSSASTAVTPSSR